MMENEPSQAPAGPRLFYEKPAIIRRLQSHLLPEEKDYTCGLLPAPHCHSEPQAKNLGMHRVGHRKNYMQVGEKVFSFASWRNTAVPFP